MIRIAVIDDHALVRAGLRQFFADQADLVVVAEGASGRDALEIVRRGDVDVVLLDISMPEQSGVDALVAIRARAPTLPVLILSGHDEAQYATLMLRQGANGFLAKDNDPDEIVKAIRQVARGRRYVSAALAERLAQSLAGPGDEPAHEHLSARELQVLLHLAQGRTIGQLARSLNLSAKTVSTYRSRVLDKLQLTSNSELTYYALKHGLIH